MKADARPDRGRRRAGPVPGALALSLAVGGLSACSAWLTPVPTPSDHGYFARSGAPPVTTAGGTNSSSSGGATGQTVHECKSPSRAARDPACFADDLGVEMDAQEGRRRELLTHASEVVNWQASYNTLVYPFGAVAVYEKLRGAPNHNLLLPAVVGTAIFATLGARIPENDKVYLRTAAELQCSLVWHGQWLYLQKEVANDRTSKDDALAATPKLPAAGEDGTTTTTTTTVTISTTQSQPSDKVNKSETSHGALSSELTKTARQQKVEVNKHAVKSSKPKSACEVRLPVQALSLGMPNLDKDAEALSTALAEFRNERACLRLKGKSDSAGAPGALERVKSPGGAKGANTSTQVTQRLELQSAQASITLDALRGLRNDIANAGLQLSGDGDVIMADMQEKMAAKVPPLTSPQAAFKALSDPNKSLARAEAGEDRALMDPVMPGTALSGLDTDSLERIEALSIGAGANLQKAWSRAQYWLDRQNRRETQVRAAAQRMPCAESTLALMNEPRRVPAPSPPASSPSGPTGSSATGNGSTSTSPLPSAVK